MTPEQITEVARLATEELHELLSVDMNQAIREAARAAVDDAPEGAKPKLTVSMQLIFELSSLVPRWKVKASVATKSVVEGETHSVPDPAQTELEFTP